MSKQLRQNQSLQLTSENKKQILLSPNNYSLFYLCDNNDHLFYEVSFFSNNNIFSQPNIRAPEKGFFEILEDDDKNSIIIFAKNNLQKNE